MAKQTDKGRAATYAQLEKKWGAVSRSSIENHRDILAARAVAGDVWRRHGLAGFTALLSQPGANAKLAKTRGRVLTGLSLMPADYSGVVDVCPMAGVCRESCVAFSGNGRYSSTVKGRTARTDLMANHPREFVTLLIAELEDMAAKYGRLGVRLNTYSDIRWERMLPADFWGHFRGVAFYDYTKHTLRSRPVDTLPNNYVLTYSHSEKTPAGETDKALAAGRNVAVVLSVRSGKDSRTGDYRPIPRKLWGRPMIDGDRVDDRYRDRAGVIVGLRRKHTLAAGSPFVVAVTA